MGWFFFFFENSMPFLRKMLHLHKNVNFGLKKSCFGWGQEGSQGIIPSDVPGRGVGASCPLNPWRGRYRHHARQYVGPFFKGIYIYMWWVRGKVLEPPP